MSEEMVEYSVKEKPLDIIVRYVKRRGKMVGCVIAKRFDECDREPTVAITGSLCRISKETFDKKHSRSLAIERAMSIVFEGRNCPVPASLKDDMIYMEARAKRYFKDCTKFVCSKVQAPKSVKFGLPDFLAKELAEFEALKGAKKFCEDVKVFAFTQTEEFQKIKKQSLDELLKTIKE